MSERAELLELLRVAGFVEASVERLAAFGAALLDANRRVNLTGAKSANDLMPHFIDALAVAPYIRGKYVDVGSGGGLPAIPVAILNGKPVTMIESIVKKAAFLRSALAELGIVGEVFASRAETAAHDPLLREQFTSGTARAVSGVSTVAELLLPYLAVGGRALLQRGTFEQSERDALTDAALMLGGRLAEEHQLEGARRIVILEKISPSPARFPRRAGAPEKRPLCLP
ncbi:MAG: 16S rRNA (guanine(527)-N(7))-methyltransferase RsmG [Candidatus Eremiobacteraeota bacterium]|nr:16S rRNA (guanine(527)-N(7))-methyltransferase RsmG [Candidatus Eremiobacteraeota bacterium]